MKIAFIGGHLSPLLAVIDELPKNIEAVVIGRKHALEGDKVVSLEYQTITKRGILFENIITGRLQRRFTARTILSLLKFPFGFIQSFAVLKKIKPDVIMSFGGSVSFPVSLAGFLLGIPIVVHEQTLEAGLSNKIVSLLAKKVCISWESSSKFFPKSKIVLTGNPIRKFPISNFLASRRSGQFPISNKFPTIYITGGSLGSHGINVLVEGCLEKLLNHYQIIHQTGDAKEYGDFDRLKKLKNNLDDSLGKRYILKKFIDPREVGIILQKADLVISRSGINSITELLYFDKPSLLIPLPFSQNNEQFKNAQFLSKQGLGEIVVQEKITPDDLYNKIIFMINNIDKYKKSAISVKILIEEDAAKKIIKVLKSTV
ncbi:MAG: UDP-N-acetylglucosamine--N-acetylmuramyl-(pentapeptide) pyrophosphoryl-undecaprenol N-acetylglucosamine transferase [Candidatus Levybacteria bacterium]|nr:UDP-N-acetylglucosamine--N-acetylmuramyl-(pentapeptide) pyrophosphoryl-undecaprenol N-acetylglucosamine transferase [Candidatus Levybacteria bacterium]